MMSKVLVAVMAMGWSFMPLADQSPMSEPQTQVLSAVPLHIIFKRDTNKVIYRNFLSEIRLMLASSVPPCGEIQGIKV